MTAKKSEEEASSEVLPKKEDKSKESKEPVSAYFSNERVLTESSDLSRELYNQSRYGTLFEDGRVQLSVIESLYLMERKKLILYNSRNKLIDFETMLKKSQKLEKNLLMLTIDLLLRNKEKLTNQDLLVLQSKLKNE